MYKEYGCTIGVYGRYVHEAIGGRGLRVERQDGDLVASNQEEGRHVLGDGFQPGHVEGSGDQALARHRQRPEQTSVGLEKS